jgi:hypothetical protein
MAQNQAVLLTLQANPVPPDLSCPQEINALLQIAAQYLSIEGLASLVGGGGVVTTNNVAAQALQLAQQANTAIAALQGQVPSSYASQAPIGLPSQNSTYGITFPSLGTVIYEVRITIQGPIGFATEYYGWRALAGSFTETSVQIIFDNMPAGCSFTWVVATLPNPPPPAA